jgi:hypothetical protein
MKSVGRARIKSGMVGGSNTELNENRIGILLGSIYVHSEPLTDSKDHVSKITKKENHIVRGH